MSVTSITSSQLYLADGSTTTFPFLNYFINQQDLLVQSIDGVGNVTTYNLNSDFVVTGTPNAIGDYPTGANIVFNVAPIAGLQLQIQRITNRTQDVVFFNNGPLTADVLNHALDKLTLLVQEGFIEGYKGTALGPPTSSTILYLQGDWYKNSNPTPGYVWGWTCTTGGSPGIWVPFGPIGLTG